MKNDKIPPCPFCGEAIGFIWEENPDFGSATALCESGNHHRFCIEFQTMKNMEGAIAELRSKLSGHRISDELYRRVVEFLGKMAIAHTNGCWKTDEKIICELCRLRPLAKQLLSELGEAKGDAEVGG